MSFIVKYLNDNEIKSIKYLQFNKKIDFNLKNTINSLPDNCYVLGVGYIHNDFQICITEHLKLNEEKNKGLKRGLSEELFLELNDGDDIKPYIEKKNDLYYKINIKDTKNLINISDENNNEKDIKTKVHVCVFGNDLEIMKYMINLGNDKKTTDQITNVWACKKEDILTLI